MSFERVYGSITRKFIDPCLSTCSEELGLCLGPKTRFLTFIYFRYRRKELQKGRITSKQQKFEPQRTYHGTSSPGKMITELTERRVFAPPLCPYGLGPQLDSYTLSARQILLALRLMPLPGKTIMELTERRVFAPPLSLSAWQSSPFGLSSAARPQLCSSAFSPQSAALLLPSPPSIPCSPSFATHSQIAS